MDDQGTNRAGGGIRFRKLRIAWSVGCGVLCLLLIVLWVRSYWWVDFVDVAHAHNAASMQGRIIANIKLLENESVSWTWELSSLEVGKWIKGWRGQPDVPWQVTVGLGVIRSPNRLGLVMSHWFLAALAATIAALPWIRQVHWRFSLRTLLIATTLLALILGTIIATIR